MRLPILTIFLILSLQNIEGKISPKLSQPKQNPTDKDFQAFPYWIKCLDSVHVPIEYARNSFYQFWKNRPVPVENDLEGYNGLELKKEKKHEKLSKKERESLKYTFEYRRFKNWENQQLKQVGPKGISLAPIDIYQKLSGDTTTQKPNNE